MRVPILPVLIAIIIGALTDFYIYRRISRDAHIPSLRNLRWRGIHLASSILLAVVMITAVIIPLQSGKGNNLTAIMWMLFTYISVYISKLFFVIPDILGSLPRLWRHPRIKTLSVSGIILSVSVFTLMWWGALINRFRTDIHNVEIYIPDLPEAFEGYRIAQLSDLHVGTYGNDTSYLAHVVAEVNALNPDLIVFTGDLVNRRSIELLPHVSTLSQLYAPDGVYSISGNHDYGDYIRWPNEIAKANNRHLLNSLQGAMGWNLLLNQTEWIRKDNDSIALIGVENIGEPPFTVYGNLTASYPGDLADNNVKILLSHNPTHWSNEIADNADKNIALTLSGHTHAMQIELFGLSPAALRYSTWGGLYHDNIGHKLYVNIGIGTIGAPMRIGATPEITLFTLTAKQNE